MRRKVIWMAVLGVCAVALVFCAAFVVETLWMLDLSKIQTLPVSSVVLDQDGQSVALLSGGQNRKPVPLSAVAQSTRDAFVAAEDARFARHHGIDWVRIGGALWQNIRHGSYRQGASTITQQLVKLTHLSSEKTLLRKAREAVLALRLETLWTKDQILEAYLNTVYFGSGAYGVEAAAEAYFGVRAEALTLEQSALLAGIVKSPSNDNPRRSPEKALSRRNLVLSAMVEAGFLTSEEAEAAKARPIELVPAPDAAQSASWYVERAAAEAASALEISYESLVTEGYKIYTALDPALQETAFALYGEDARFPADAADGARVESALVCLDAQSGAIRCLIGGRRYETERGLNRASDIARQPGSAFKPISVYAAAVEQFGYLPVSTVSDEPRDFGGGYQPGNFGDKTYGLVTLREALSRSLNVATLDLASKTGIDAALETARRTGLTLDASDRNLAMALGSLTRGVSPEALTGAYAALANGGQRVAPFAVLRIENRDGETVYTHKTEPARAFSAETACLVTDMLVSAATWGSARSLSALPFPVAGKTGTVGEPGGGNRDLWTVAYTGRLVATVWMGFDQPGGAHVMSDQATGSSHPARLLEAFLERAGGRADAGAFPLPGSLRRVLIDERALQTLHRAQLAGPYTPKSLTLTEVFPVSRVPTEVSTVWQAPSAVFDLAASRTAEGIRLSFTAVDDDALYQIERDGHVIGSVQGKRGETLAFVDTDGADGASYRVLPVYASLLKEGVTLAGAPSAAVTLAGPDAQDAPEATPAPETALF